MRPRQLIAFLPKTVCVKFPPHVALHIEVDDHDEDEIVSYGAQQWLHLMRTLGQMHENPIQLRLQLCTFGPSMLRALYEVSMDILIMTTMLDREN